MADEENVVSFHSNSYTRTDTEGKQSQLAKQDLNTLDVEKLDALTPEVISRQATINIGAFSVPFLFFFSVQ